MVVVISDCLCGVTALRFMSYATFALYKFSSSSSSGHGSGSGRRGGGGRCSGSGSALSL